MLERVQESSALRIFGENACRKLSGAQKALAQWAIVDDYNTVLDLHCRDTRLLRYLSQKFSLRACGVADDAADARVLQQALPDAEIFCARKEDIPWRDNSFDAVFYQVDKNEPDCGSAFLEEALRVLKPCGQLLVAVSGIPEALCRLSDLAGFSSAADRVKPHDLLQRMEKAGYGDISYRIAPPFVGLAMGWKRN